MVGTRTINIKGKSQFWLKLRGVTRPTSTQFYMVGGTKFTPAVVSKKVFTESEVSEGYNDRLSGEMMDG